MKLFRVFALSIAVAVMTLTLAPVQSTAQAGSSVQGIVTTCVNHINYIGTACCAVIEGKKQCAILELRAAAANGGNAEWLTYLAGQKTREIMWDAKACEIYIYKLYDVCRCRLEGSGNRHLVPRVFSAYTRNFTKVYRAAVDARDCIDMELRELLTP